MASGALVLLAVDGRLGVASVEEPRAAGFGTVRLPKEPTGSAATAGAGVASAGVARLGGVFLAGTAAAGAAAVGAGAGTRAESSRHFARPA